MIKAIETRYKGYRFRSRLEARWAVFFDALGIRYKYEEYGFEKDGYKWLPDFYLTDLGTWVEVKGGKPSYSDAEKMGAILDNGSPLPFFDNCWENDMIFSNEFYEMGGNSDYVYGTCAGLLLLGDIPYVSHGIVVHTMITHHKGLVRTAASFYQHARLGGHIKRLKQDEMAMFSHFCGVEIEKELSGADFILKKFSGDSTYPFDFNPSTYVAEARLAQVELCQAYQKARAARFEHGECG